MEPPPWLRPSHHAIQDAHNLLFNSNLTRSKLEENATNGALFRGKIEPQRDGLVGRSLAWKVFLIPTPPLTAELSDRPIPPITELKATRARYGALLRSFMRAPDGSHDESFLSGQAEPLTPAGKVELNWEKNNPLSLDEQNPWRQWFAAVELRKSILLDVERTFPDLVYFRHKRVQKELTNILHVHSATYPDIGYRQGMHELLAALYVAVDYDSIDRKSTEIEDQDVLDMCDRAWVAADAWSLFEVIMSAINPWYEWREPKIIGPRNGPVEIKPSVAPIASVCNRIQSQYLSKVDPALWEKMNEAGIEPQIYGIRWLRLLFTREFTVEDSMLLWDAIFAVDSSLEISPWVCVAMLIRIRNKLIPAEYTEQLTCLMRYPPVDNPFEGVAPTVLLVQQALRLQQFPHPSTGVSVVLQNRDLLDIPAAVPDRPARPVRRTRELRSASVYGRLPVMQIQSATESQVGLPEVIARNLLDKSEGLGINRAFFNTVSEIRRNLSELPGTITRSTSNLSSTSLPSFSPEYERPPWEFRTRLEVEGEVEALRNQQKQLAEGMGWAIDALLHDTAMWRGKDGNADEGSVEKRRRMEALECLAYVQEVLSRGGVGGVDEERLLGGSEIARRKNVTEESPVVVSPPIPPAQEANLLVPKSDPLGGRPKTLLSTRDSKPSVSLPRTAVRPTPVINPLALDPLTSLASVVSPTTSTPLRRPITNSQPVSTGELYLSTRLPVTEGTRSAFSPTNTTPTISLSRERGYHAPKSSTSNVVHAHGHRNNKSSEVHVPSSSPSTSAKANPSGYPPSPNTYPPVLFSPSKPQAGQVASDPLGALGS